MTVMLAPLLIALAAAPLSPKDTFLHSDLGSGSEAAIPRHLIWGVTRLAPEIFGGTEREFFLRYGMILDPDSREGLPFGMVPVRDPLGAPYLVFNCAWCHVARVAGQIVLGAGNRELRQADMTRDLIQFAADPRFTVKKLTDAAHAEARRRGQIWHLGDSIETAAIVFILKREQARHWRSDNAPIGPGLSIPSFIAQEKRFDMKPPERLWPVVKYPSIWSYGVRSSFSSGGNFFGDISEAILAPEFTKGRAMGPMLQHPEPFEAVYRWMLQTPPPKFPFPLDAELAQRGEEIYLVECQSCHGTNAHGDYRELTISIDEVKTDEDRLGAFSPGFDREVAKLKMPRAGFRYTHGYVAPQHDGLWARAPYLHNGSVPNLALLLTPPEERPRVFYVGGELPYDASSIGDRCTPTRENGVSACAPAHEGMFRYDTREAGRGNGGHVYGTRLPLDDKRALLEYLKTL